jgi:hypothetical protein
MLYGKSELKTGIFIEVQENYNYKTISLVVSELK